VKAAVLGKPISHSKSPQLHRAAYRLLGVDLDYQRLELDPADAPDFAARLRAGGWAGCSVTMPLKDVFISHMDSVTDLVTTTGALNTIVVHPDGTLHGQNTDVYGIVRAFADAGIGHTGTGTILGAGNTALAAVQALHQMGAERVRFVVRDPARAGRVTALAAALGMATEVSPVREISGDPVVVSTLPPSAADGWVSTLGAGTGTLLDVAYDPWPSALAAAWRGPVINGLAMLVHQAVEQVRLFTGLDLAQEERENVTNTMFAAVALHRGR